MSLQRKTVEGFVDMLTIDDDGLGLVYKKNGKRTRTYGRDRWRPSSAKR